MQPIDELIFNDGTLNKDDFNTSLMSSITYEGQTMAVPFDNHGWLLWHNTKLLEDAGLDPNNLPQNGDEFIEWAQQLTTDANGLHPKFAHAAGGVGHSSARQLYSAWIGFCGGIYCLGAGLDFLRHFPA